MTAEQLKEEEAVATSRAKFYIASVSGWDIARADFDNEVTYAKKLERLTQNQSAGGAAVLHVRPDPRI